MEKRSSNENKQIHETNKEEGGYRRWKDGDEDDDTKSIDSETEEEDWTEVESCGSEETRDGVVKEEIKPVDNWFSDERILLVSSLVLIGAANFFKEYNQL